MSHRATSEDIAAARRAYAEELRFAAKLRSTTLVEAFATVPRERFLGAGPWRIKSPWDIAEYWTPDGGDPRAVYHDVLVALDEARGINNGQPALWAFLFDRLAIAEGEDVLHFGCGTGYYTAIIAALVGNGGTVRALALDAQLAERARQALLPWPHVIVDNLDAAAATLTPADLIVASAGATHPPPTWLDALKPGGRLLFPLTASGGFGGMRLVTRSDSVYAARLLCPAAFMDCAGARDAGIEQRLTAAFVRDRGRPVQSLRRHRHAASESCWLHADDWCLSRDRPAPG